ncbi:MAG: ThuA domain-containing protein [Lentisphaeria bacterium]|nr:ThuA domain-containing protein [Lentisphaeria bacterium]
MSGKIRVTVWNEFRHEIRNERVKAVYPDGMHTVIGEGLLETGDFEVKYAWLDKDPEHGLSEEVLQNTDVLVWWGHMAHADVKDEIVDRVQKHILQGMGLIVLHSGHFSKIFRRMLGTTCSLKWREVAEKERIWTVEPAHPIAQGLPEHFELPHTEMYGERFDIPTPKDVVFITWYEGGEVFRSGVTFERGYGRIFYFAPGHETFPIFRDANIRRVIANAARWAAPRIRREITCPSVPALEDIRTKPE